MTTARSKLHAEIVEAIGSADKATLESRLGDILDRYRVQFKKSQAAAAGKTARGALLENVMELAANPPIEVMEPVANILDDFRMQTKSPGGSKKARKGKAGRPAKAATPIEPAPVNGPQAPVEKPPPSPAMAALSESFRSLSIVDDESDSKGKRSARAECPKCHSMGVVLARSYAADEYYSCIYCGWQGYKSPEALEQEDSLAARLLGLYTASARDGEEQ